MNWFYNHKGKLKGPLSTAEVQNLIAEQALGPDDLVYPEGEKKWVPLSELADFRAAFNLQTPHPIDPQPISWVVLQRDSSTRKIRQVGPFSTKKLHMALREEQIKLSDYVWRAGMKEWYRIISIPELAQFESSGKVDPKEGVEQAELLKNVVELEVRPAPPEEVPEEARSEGPLKPVELGKPSKRAEPNGSKLKKMESLRSKNWRVYSVRFLILLGFIFLGFSFFSKWKKLDQQQVQTERTAEAVTAGKKSDPDVGKGAKAVVPPKQRPSPEPPRPPSYARLNYSKKDGILSVHTDASSSYRTYLLFESEMGKVIGAPSYFRQLRMSARDLNLHALQWPEGLYKVSLTLGEKKDHATVFIGKGGSDFEERLAAHKKRLSMDFMNEKRWLVEDSTSALELAQSLLKAYRQGGQAQSSVLKSWDGRMKDWGSVIVRRIGPKSRNSYILAKHWLELKIGWKELRKIRAKIASPEPQDLAALQELTQKLQSLANQSQGLSLWR